MASNGGGGFSRPSGGPSPGEGSAGLGKKLGKKPLFWNGDRKRKRDPLGDDAANAEKSRPLGPDAPPAKAANALGAAAASRPRGPGVHPQKTNDTHAKSNCTTPNSQSLGAAVSADAGQPTSAQDVEKRTWGEKVATASKTITSAAGKLLYQYGWGMAVEREYVHFDDGTEVAQKGSEAAGAAPAPLSPRKTNDNALQPTTPTPTPTPTKAKRRAARGEARAEEAQKAKYADRRESRRIKSAAGARAREQGAKKEREERDAKKQRERDESATFLEFSHIARKEERKLAKGGSAPSAGCPGGHPSAAGAEGDCTAPESKSGGRRSLRHTSPTDADPRVGDTAATGPEKGGGAPAQAAKGSGARGSRGEAPAPEAQGGAGGTGRNVRDERRDHATAPESAQDVHRTLEETLGMFIAPSKLKAAAARLTSADIAELHALRRAMRGGLEGLLRSCNGELTLEQHEEMQRKFLEDVFAAMPEKLKHLLNLSEAFRECVEGMMLFNYGTTDDLKRQTQAEKDAHNLSLRISACVEVMLKNVPRWMDRESSDSDEKSNIVCDTVTVMDACPHVFANANAGRSRKEAKEEYKRNVREAAQEMEINVDEYYLIKGICMWLEIQRFFLKNGGTKVMPVLICSSLGGGKLFATMEPTVTARLNLCGNAFHGMVYLMGNITAYSDKARRSVNEALTAFFRHILNLPRTTTLADNWGGAMTPEEREELNRLRLEALKKAWEKNDAMWAAYNNCEELSDEELKCIELILAALARGRETQAKAWKAYYAGKADPGQRAYVLHMLDILASAGEKGRETQANAWAAYHNNEADATQKAYVEHMLDILAEGRETQANAWLAYYADEADSEQLKYVNNQLAVLARARDARCQYTEDMYVLRDDLAEEVKRLNKVTLEAVGDACLPALLGIPTGVKSITFATNTDVEIFANAAFDGNGRFQIRSKFCSRTSWDFVVCPNTPGNAEVAVQQARGECRVLIDILEKHHLDDAEEKKVVELLRRLVERSEVASGLEPQLRHALCKAGEGGRLHEVEPVLLEALKGCSPSNVATVAFSSTKRAPYSGASKDARFQITCPNQKWWKSGDGVVITTKDGNSVKAAKDQALAEAIVLLKLFVERFPCDGSTSKEMVRNTLARLLCRKKPDNTARLGMTEKERVFGLDIIPKKDRRYRDKTKGNVKFCKVKDNGAACSKGSTGKHGMCTKHKNLFERHGRRIDE